MPGWLRVVLVLFAGVALLDEMRTPAWSALSPAPAVLFAMWMVLSYGAVALLAWSPSAGATAITLSYASCLVVGQYSVTLLCGCVVMAVVIAMLPRRPALIHLALTALWLLVTAIFLRSTDYAWVLGLPLGAAALLGVAVRFFLGQYRLNSRRLAVMEATHERLREQERLALARDLHDVVAHELTLVTMQAAGSQRQTDPAELHRTIDTMDTAARSGLTELRTLLHILRDSPRTTSPAGPESDQERGNASGLTTGSLHGVAETLGILLAQVVDLAELGGVLHPGQQGVLAGLLELRLERGNAVEVVLQGPLGAPGDHEDVVQAGVHGLLHHVLDGRAVHDRQHLLRHRLGGGQETGAQASRGNDGLVYARGLL